MPLVLLNRRSTPFGTQKLLPFEIVTGEPLDSSLFWPTTDKMRGISTHLATWKFPLLEETLPKRPSSTLLGRPLSGSANQPLCHQAQGNRHLDSHDTPKERTDPDWTCTSSGDLKVKIFWNWSRWYLIRQLSQDIQVRSFESLSAKPLMVARCFRWSPVSMILITWALDKKCLRFLPLTPACYSNVTSIGFLTVHFHSNMRYYTQERSFLAWGLGENCLNWKIWLLISNVFRERSQSVGRSVKINKEKPHLK